jgi:hypothetical protein
MHLFEEILSVSVEEIELELRGLKEISWADFWLNPRSTVWPKWYCADK